MRIHFVGGFGRRRYPCRFKTLTLAFDIFQLLVEARPAFIIHQTQLAAHFSQTQNGIVLT